MKVIEIIRHTLSNILGYNEDYFGIVDSMPIYACKFGRAHFHKTFRNYASYGRCASKKETYYSFKLHSLVALDGYITDFTLTPANIDDREGLCELTNQTFCLTIIGDKGYIGNNLYLEFKKERGITLISMQRSNSKIQLPKSIRQLIFKKRRLIETVNSRLSKQLNISKILAKSRWGLIAKIETKILAHNICCFINKALKKV